MRFHQPLVAGRFVSRDNRFRATVEVNGHLASAHVPNSGRMRELLIRGVELRLIPAMNASRATAYDLLLVRNCDGWVCIDSRLPPRLLGEWLASGGGGPLAGWHVQRAEVVHGDSRFDLLLRRGVEMCWVETKSVSLVRDGTALFPDAPTERGRRDLLGLAELARKGICAAVVFVVQRGDAKRFSPNNETDPEFGAALRAAAVAGVGALCLGCRVDAEGLEIAQELPLRLGT